MRSRSGYRTPLQPGTSALIWLLLLGVPYPLLLAALVALLDIVPVVGSVTAGVITSLVALTVSGPVALACWSARWCCPGSTAADRRRETWAGPERNRTRPT